MLRTNLHFLAFFEELYLEQTTGIQNIVVKKFPKNSFLLTQGSPLTELVIIRAGATKCYFSEENGKDFIVEFLGAGEIAGEIEVLKSRSCLCNIVALTEVEAYSVKIPFFKTLLTKNLDLNRHLLDVLAERIIHTSSRSSSQQLYTTEYGLAKMLEFQEQQNLEISKEDMAAYLGITVRSLNRTLKQLKL